MGTLGVLVGLIGGIMMLAAMKISLENHPSSVRQPEVGATSQGLTRSLWTLAGCGVALLFGGMLLVVFVS